MASQPTPDTHEIRAHVNQSADGTRVEDTAREDRDLGGRLKALGFRWSRNLDAWYLPRTWGEATRLRRVQSLQAQLGNQITVTISDEPRQPAAVREADQQQRAAARAERLDTRADKADAASAAADAQRHHIEDVIPMGQPVLKGHYSQRAHEKALNTIDRTMRTSIDQDHRASAARAGADRARTAASGEESVIRIGNRIERTEAEIRQRTRRRDGTGKAIHGEDTPAEGDYRARLDRRLIELADQLAHDQTKLAAAGGALPFGKDTVRRGDFVRIGDDTWYPVLRANAKTVTVPHPCLAADSTVTQTTPWRQVQQHLPHDQATPDHLYRLAAHTPRAFPGLRSRLARLAEALQGELG